MDLSTYTDPENHPSLVEATRKALRFYPEFVSGEHSVDDLVQTISFMLTEGDPGMVVYAWGRRLAADILAGIKGMDGDERLAKLAEAIDSCISIRDDEGNLDLAEFHTVERAALQAAIDKHHAENPAPAPGSVSGLGSNA